MRTICVAGKNDIAVDVMLHCLNHYCDYRIVCITNKNETGINAWQKSLGWFAEENNVEIVSLDEVYEIEDLIFLSTEFDRIINPSKFKSENLYNIHFSLLPKYKGCYTSVMPILNGETKTGVTFHKIRRGIDTGEIIDQEEIVIDESYTSYDLYERLIDLGTKVVIRNLDRIIDGNFELVSQSKQNSTYYSPKTINYSALELDINSTAFQIQNQIRAFCFRPYQILKWGNNCFVHCEITDNASQEKPGTMLEENDIVTEISTIDYDVILYKDNFERALKSIESEDNYNAKRYCSCKEIINSKDSHGWSPLTVAVYNGNFDMVKFLLKNNADYRVRNNNGTTLLMYAKDLGLATGEWEIFKLLLGYGLDVVDKDYRNRSLLDYLESEDMNKIPSDIKRIIAGGGTRK